MSHTFKKVWNVVSTVLVVLVVLLARVAREVQVVQGVGVVLRLVVLGVRVVLVGVWRRRVVR